MATVYNTSDFRKGLRVELDGEPYLVVESEFRKPGKGQAVYTLKLKNLLQGNVISRNYRSGDKIDGADVEEHSLQYLYNDASNWHFMDPDNFEQYAVAKELLGDAWKWLVDETMVDVVFWNGKPITVTPPNHAELKVEFCEPGARGNTASNVQKPAKLETGAEVPVPIFINIGDVVKVDTRTGEYVERVQKA
jgi:elongation factor P